MSNINHKIINAAKWSTVSQIVSKLISPITNMILARLLAPEAFGVVATVTMIFSFADMFTDAGFQKYLIQHDFSSNNEKENAANVAFWSNITFSLLIWVIIAIFSKQISILVGSPGLDHVIIISCISLPLTSFSSIQIALYRRSLNFKSLFKIQLIVSLVPLFITIPLAVIFRNYWALIIGTICSNLINAILLTLKSEWKIKLFYRVNILKEMLAFSIWSLMESLTVWLTNYIGTFIVGLYLTTYYTGLYKTSINTVNQILNIIIASTTPVLFSGLSRLKDDEISYNKMFFKFQSIVAVLVIPMGVGIFLYSDVVTKILLGDQWIEASNLIGLWGLTSALVIVLSNYCSEVYRSKGKPKLSVLVQILHLVFLVPVIVLSAKQGFEQLIFWRSIARLQIIIINAIIITFIIRISFFSMIKNILPQIIASFIMMLLSFILRSISNNFIWNIISIGICASVYMGVLYMFFPEIKKQLNMLISNVILKNKKYINKKVS